MADIPRISVQDARESMQSGQATLVCAYEDDDKCRRMRLQNAISFNDFRRRLRILAKDQPIILYCA